MTTFTTRTSEAAPEAKDLLDGAQRVFVSLPNHIASTALDATFAASEWTPETVAVASTH